MPKLAEYVAGRVLCHAFIVANPAGQKRISVERLFQGAIELSGVLLDFSQ